MVVPAAVAGRVKVDVLTTVLPVGSVSTTVCLPGVVNRTTFPCGSTVVGLDAPAGRRRVIAGRGIEPGPLSAVNRHQIARSDCGEEIGGGHSLCWPGPASRCRSSEGPRRRRSGRRPRRPGWWWCSAPPSSVTEAVELVDAGRRERQGEGRTGVAGRAKNTRPDAGEGQGLREAGDFRRGERRAGDCSSVAADVTVGDKRPERDVRLARRDGLTARSVRLQSANWLATGKPERHSCLPGETAVLEIAADDAAGRRRHWPACPCAASRGTQCRCRPRWWLD